MEPPWSSGFSCSSYMLPGILLARETIALAVCVIPPPMLVRKLYSILVYILLFTQAPVAPVAQRYLVTL